MSEPYFPKGWDLKRVQDVIAHYDNQTEDEAVEELERAFDERDEEEGISWIAVPKELVNDVNQFIAQRQSA